MISTNVAVTDNTTNIFAVPPEGKKLLLAALLPMLMDGVVALRGAQL